MHYVKLVKRLKKIQKEMGAYVKEREKTNWSDINEEWEFNDDMATAWEVGYCKAIADVVLIISLQKV